MTYARSASSRKNRDTAVATTLTDIEKSISKEFTHEVELRQAVIDALWVGNKEFEKTFVRDYPLTRFVFFPFQKGNANNGSTWARLPVM